MIILLIYGKIHFQGVKMILSDVCLWSAGSFAVAQSGQRGRVVMVRGGEGALSVCTHYRKCSCFSKCFISTEAWGCQEPPSMLFDYCLFCTAWFLAADLQSFLLSASLTALHSSILCGILFVFAAFFHSFHIFCFMFSFYILMHIIFPYNFMLRSLHFHVCVHVCVSIHQYADGRYWVYSPVLGRRKLNSSSSYNVSHHQSS